MVGNGMAGVRTIEELLKIAPELYDITVFGAEPHPNYNRILLSPVLAGEQTIDEIVLNPRQWYADNGITLHTGRRIVDVDRRRRIVRADDGSECEYDRLLLATGSNPLDAAGARPRSGRRHRLPRHRRHASDDRRGGAVQACRRHRRRAARPGGRERAQAARHGRDGGALDAVADGAPARRHRRQAVAALARGARAQVPDRQRERSELVGSPLEGADTPRSRVRSVRFKDGS